MNLKHDVAENKYQQYRDRALEQARRNLPIQIRDKVKFRNIDNEALLIAKVWESSPLRKELPWSFAQGFKKWAFRHPNRLDLAVWYENNLCSLSIGFPTKTGKSMRLDVIEKNPCNYPLDKSIFAINIVAFEEFADLIGADKIKIMRPLNDRLINFYRSYGFIYQKSKGSEPEHLWKYL
ncbi:MULTISPECIES: hypothetical protein [Pseudoalteromonas]|nr:hypothetical protein [Pseudoalteromonas prydzensis]MBE0376138.1 hypothetical protein [Pseudoalteromonas prydzensis ACAM 620]